MSMVFRGAAARTFALAERTAAAGGGVKTAAVPADRRDAAARQRGVSRAAGYGGLRRGGACGAGCRRAYVRADGTMELPDDETYGGLIKNVSTVSGHEQRLCFPLDSVRRANGKYPPCATEVVYPGCTRILVEDIHRGSGKANGENDSLLLSQVVLNDLYSASFGLGPSESTCRHAAC